MTITAAQVIKLFPNETIADIAMESHVDDAKFLVDEVLGSSSLSDGRLDMIAKNLAAHFYVLAAHEGGIFEETIGESSEKRGSTFTLGQGLKLTRFGQMVLSLDTTGRFKDSMGLSKDDKKTALFRLA